MALKINVLETTLAVGLFIGRDWPSARLRHTETSCMSWKKTQVSWYLTSDKKSLNAKFKLQMFFKLKSRL